MRMYPHSNMNGKYSQVTPGCQELVVMQGSFPVVSSNMGNPPVGLSQARQQCLVPIPFCPRWVENCCEALFVESRCRCVAVPTAEA